MDPLQVAGTSWDHACLLLVLSFRLSNFVHALSFVFIIRHFPAGSMPAGVMRKGLQAVLVFVVTSVACGVLWPTRRTGNVLLLVKTHVAPSGCGGRGLVWPGNRAGDKRKDTKQLHNKIPFPSHSDLYRCFYTSTSPDNTKFESLTVPSHHFRRR